MKQKNNYKYKIIVGKADKRDDTIFINVYNNESGDWLGETIAQDFIINGQWFSSKDVYYIDEPELINLGLSNDE